MREGRPQPSLEKFHFPDFLERLGKVEQDPPSAVLSFLDINELHTDCRWSPYACTPPDLLQFAWTGSDGIHFGFLTDFGSVTDLEGAPIVCVSPRSRDAITIVARNLRDFVTALCQIKNGNEFSELQYFAARPDDDWWTTYGLNPTDELYEEVMKSAAAVKERLGLGEIADYRSYLIDLWAERKRSLSIETKDGLGVVRSARSDSSPGAPFDFELEENKDLENMRAFLQQASHDVALAFFRDAQHYYDFRPWGNPVVRTFVADALCERGYEFEGERIRSFGK